MSDSKGFTLIEILVVLVILGILAAISVPNYVTYMEQGSAKAAQNNLIAIYNAQKNYYLGPVGSGSYCIAGCNNLTNINTNLNLNITDSNFNYACTNASGFTCTATNKSDGAFTLKVTKNSIVLPGAATCPTGTEANPNCNPSCAYAAHSNYCHS